MGMQERSKRDSVILVCHMLAVHHSSRIIKEMKMGVVLIDWLKCNTWKNVDRGVFESNLMKRKKRLDPSEVEHCLKKRLIIIC